ncbi:MAG: cytochrome P450 [Candidatus Competibacteraceae bacterium]|nr:cytochrome P450 [Candidatus Competibacteraceae bacterium]
MIHPSQGYSTGFDLNDPDTQRDPYPSYRWLREHAPVYRIPGAPMWVLSRHEDISRVLRDHRTFSSNMGIDIPIMSLVMKDPPDHERLRKSLGRAFTPRQIQHLAPRIEMIAETLAAEMDERSEFISAFADPLPITVICEMLGVPTEQRAAMKQWSRDALLASFAAKGFGTPEQLARATRGLEALLAYLDQVIDIHQAQPRDNLISALIAVQREGLLSRDEVRYFCCLLLIAGHETTGNLLGSGMAILAENTELWTRLKTQPEQIPGFVEETVRTRPPLQRIVRRTTCAVEIAGVQLPADALLMLLPGSANRDAGQWSAPDEFALDRDHGGHLGFGAGIHYCLGAPLARLEGRIAFEVLLRRFRTIRLDPERPSMPITGFASGSLGWETLPLCLERG